MRLKKFIIQISTMIKDIIMKEESRDICRSSLKMLLNTMFLAGLTIHDLYMDVLADDEKILIDSMLSCINDMVNNEMVQGKGDKDPD